MVRRRPYARGWGPANVGRTWAFHCLESKSAVEMAVSSCVSQKKKEGRLRFLKGRCGYVSR